MLCAPSPALPQREAVTKAKVQEKKCAKRLAVSDCHCVTDNACTSQHTHTQ